VRDRSLPLGTRQNRARAAHPLRRGLRLGVLGALLGYALVLAAACTWDPKKPFERESPVVRQAIGELDGGDATAATGLLEDYLTTGACAEGNIGAPPSLTDKPSGAFDLGLALFRVGEAFGRRFGDEETGEQGKPEKQAAEDPQHAQRMSEIDCALRIVRAVATSERQPTELRARARYLEGNLEFLGGQYEDAVTAYDAAITLDPGETDGGSALGRDAAWNRAIAIRRIEDKKDAGNEGGQDGSPDGSGDGGASDGGGQSDSGQDSGNHGDDEKKKDAGGPDAKEDAPSPSPPDGGPPPPPPDAAPPPPSRASQDDRILDSLENAPTVQQEFAKKQQQKHHPRSTMEDK
jgi:hypothetical protein